MGELDFLNGAAKGFRDVEESGHAGRWHVANTSSGLCRDEEITAARAISMTVSVGEFARGRKEAPPKAGNAGIRFAIILRDMVFMYLLCTQVLYRLSVYGMPSLVENHAKDPTPPFGICPHGMSYPFVMS
jgi:hypothetical protein